MKQFISQIWVQIVFLPWIIYAEIPLTAEERSILPHIHLLQYHSDEIPAAYIPHCGHCQNHPLPASSALTNVISEVHYPPKKMEYKKRPQATSSIYSVRDYDGSGPKAHYKYHVCHNGIGCDNDNVQYQFEYAVNDYKTGDIKRHKERRKNDVVSGEYSLVEADGNIRTVKYYADWHSGFHAHVHNSKPK